MALLGKHSVAGEAILELGERGLNDHQFPQRRKRAPGAEAGTHGECHVPSQAWGRARQLQAKDVGARKTQGRAIPRDSEGARVSDFQPPEPADALSLKPAGLWYFVTAALGNQHRSEM